MSNFKFLTDYSKKRLHIYISLFIFTFITCLIAGTYWANEDYSEIMNWHHGITYTILILTFLSAHEFGHYIAARIHKVDATLPYYIPFPIPFVLNFGTLGAVIKIRDRIPSKNALFDIGVAGPLSGFIVATGFLIYGLMTLPGVEYIYHIHPEYFFLNHGHIPEYGLHFGDTAYFSILSYLFKNPEGFLPPMNEIYHYPFLNVGWFGLFVTTLNMLPMGQLDGGHITYAMFGNKQRIISRVVWWLLVAIGILSLVTMSYDLLQYEYENKFINELKDFFLPFLTYLKSNYGLLFSGWSGWLFWAIIAKFFIKLDHPPIDEYSKLDKPRMFIGWFSLIVLLLSFSYQGVFFVE
jgi:membrane-associated protease RseP (regulator of RpoE activity)